jgi:hypothetical protein
VKVEETPGWHDDIHATNRALLSDTLVQMHEIADRTVPIDSGHLKSRLYSYTNTDGTEGVLGDDADYALWVEDGHLVAWRGEDGEIHYNGNVVPPQPFLRVAVNSVQLRRPE